MPNPFVRPKERPQCPGTNFGKVEDDLIYEYEVKPRLIRTGKNEFDFITKDTVVLVRKYNRSDAINEHSDEVGILNIINKVRATGDSSLLNQRVPQFENKTIEDLEDKLNASISAKENFANLDPELTGGKSFNDFTEKPMTQEQFDAYIDKKVQEKLAQTQVNNDNEGGN